MICSNMAVSNRLIRKGKQRCTTTIWLGLHLVFQLQTGSQVCNGIFIDIFVAVQPITSLYSFLTKQYIAIRFSYGCGYHFSYCALEGFLKDMAIYTNIQMSYGHNLKTSHLLRNVFPFSFQT